MRAIRKDLRDTLHIDDQKHWFRGVSLRALELSVVFLIPVISTANGDNEFGPGIYATDCFEESLAYAKNGASMVFKNPDFRQLNVWVPTKEEWNCLLAIWLEIQIPNIKIIIWSNRRSYINS